MKSTTKPMSKSKNSDTTPLMAQYLEIKAKYKDMILLYRMGDFYETFYDDAKIIAKVLGIALTKRAHGKSADVPLAGFPYHALDNYLPKLIKAGHRVAICEQVEDPKKAKTVVKREVVEIVTPGTALSEKLLDNKNNNFIAAVYLKGQDVGVGYGDLSTGELYIAEIQLEQLINFLQEISPKEILVPANRFEDLRNSFTNRINAVISKMDDWIFTYQFAYDTLTGHFQTPNLKGFGAEAYTLGVICAGALLQYSKENFQNDLSHIRKLSVISADDYMILDSSTRRNLEITSSISGQDQEGTLLSILDHTLTPMGGRLLRQIISHPLIKLDKILQRLHRVKALFDESKLRAELRDMLSHISDLERLLGRVATGRATPRDLVTLKNALMLVEPIRKLLATSKDKTLTDYADQFHSVEEVIQLIDNAISDNPPQNLTEGGIIKEGFHQELDDLRNISNTGKDYIVNLQTREREKTGIPSLKIGFNKVFGYYFEITKTHQSKVPDYFIRKQTLVNAERYITPELKEFEEKVLGAEEKIASLEYELFQEIREKVANWGAAIQTNARIIAELDCWACLAYHAVMYNYTMPEINDGDEIEIIGGRHPVVEALLPPDEPFIENDIKIDNTHTQIMIITGPNMSGKSTYLRQVGLITLLAQIGSFVPAQSAKIGVVDRIFTRVGASDNVAFGESTFMVEMLETANILNNATPRSLILLDEIGRGTSTFDGLSIAWAVTEYIHHNKRVAAKTLFATHYHELTELAMLYPRVKNFRVAVKEYEDHVVFLRKIEPGGMDNSYGIYVAQMAGLPELVIERAKEVLRNLEANELTPNRTTRLSKRRDTLRSNPDQLTLFEIPTPSPIEAELRKIDLNHLTPIDALLKLKELKEKLDSVNK
jgi:DNA mismatch repair protein MutS